MLGEIKYNMLSDALSYPQSGNGWRPVLIGGLLSLFNWLLLPVFIVFGYFLRVLRSAALEEDQAPRFEDLGDLLVDGFKSFLIFLGYVFLPLLLELIILFSAGSISGEGRALFAVVGLIGVMFLFVMFYLFPVALTAFALTDDLGEAFKFRTIVKSAFTGDYAVGVIISVLFRIGIITALSIIMYVIVFIFGFVFLFSLIGLGGDEASIGVGLSITFIVGILLYVAMVVLFSIVDFYAKMAMYYLLGRGCGSSLRDAVPVDRPTPAGASDVGLERSDVGSESDVGPDRPDVGWDSDVDSESEDGPSEER